MIDRAAIILAERDGIDLGRGYLRKTDGRYVLWYADAFPASNKNPKGPRTALRSRVIWWLFTGEVIRGQEADIHHRNHDRTDDRILNLEKMSRGDHGAHHHTDPRSNVTRICAGCGASFIIKRHKLRERSRGTFCSLGCYHTTPRSDSHKNNISRGMEKAWREGRR